MEQILPGYTRISEILSIFQAYSHVDRAKLKKAQDIGTLVHEAIEKFLKCDFSPIVMPVTPYFESFLKWHEAAQITPLAIERRIYDDSLKITGKIDLLAEIDGIPVIVDFKTGSWAHPEIWKLQATFYRELIVRKAIGKEPPEHFLFVQLKSDGSEPVLYPMEYNPFDWTACEGAIACYNYFINTSELLLKQKTPS